MKEVSGSVKMNNRTTDFTTGKPLPLMLSFFGPLLLTSLLQQLYNFVDALIVGKGLGDNAIAAVGNMGSLFFLVVGFSLGMANGFGIIISQKFGAKDYEQMKRNFAGTLELAAVFSIVLTALSLLFLPKALIFLQTDELIIDDCLRYGYIVLGGLVTAIIYNVGASMLRSLGDSRTPLYAIITSSIVNVILDYFFIFIMHTGVEGAAIATVVSQLISGLVCFIRISRIDMIIPERKHFINPVGLYVNLIKNGIPMALMNSITAIGCMVVQYFVNGYGVNYTSAYAACSRYVNLFMNPAFTAGNTMSAFTSQNYGAGNYDRIRKGLHICLIIALITYATLGSALFFFPEALARILLSGDETVRLAVSYLPICGVSLIGVDLLFVYRSAVQGMGRPLIPMLSGALEMIMRISAISLFMGAIGFRAAAFAETAAWFSALTMNLVTYYIVYSKITNLKIAVNKSSGKASKKPALGKVTSVSSGSYHLS